MRDIKVGITVIGASETPDGTHSYTGTVEAGEASVVSFTVPGTITVTYAKVGQQVSRGQVLARVRSESLEKTRSMAQAQLVQAQDAYRRLKMLHDANALPDIRWVEVQQQLKMAQDAVALADIAVGDATIHSPINGYVAEKLADAGQSVMPSQPIYRLVNLGDIQMSVSVPEEEISAFRPGMRAVITLDALDSLRIVGVVAQRGVEANAFSRTFTVKFDIPNPQGRILPGMIGKVRIDLGKAGESRMAPGGYRLPSQALLLSADNRQFVWVAVHGRAERRFVQASELAPEGVTVMSGLAPGDTVITEGMQKISTGSRVTFSTQTR